jgi:hypothetical protein
MKSMHKALWVAIFFLTSTVIACVTINIYFPAEEVETVAEDIVDDIRGREGNKPEKEGQKDSMSMNLRLCFGSSTAWAADVTEVSNATIRGLKEQMKERYQQLKPYYDKGLLKEGDDGYLSIGDLGGLGLKEKRDLKSLVEAENNDRKELYKEVAKAMDIDPSQIGRVGEVFAKEWQE